MKLIWKYTLPAAECTLKVPKGAEFLSVAAQGGRIVAYFMVNPGARGDDHHQFTCANTGAAFDLSSRSRFVCTLSMEGIVWHVFRGQL